MTMINARQEDVMVCPGCRRHCPVNFGGLTGRGIPVSKSMKKS